MKNTVIEIPDIKKRVIEQSLKLFMKYGVKSITMDEIAKECGISKRTLYENFRDKDELLATCLKAMHTQMKKERLEIEKGSADALEIFMDSVRQVAEKSNQINPNFHRELHKFYPKIGAIQIEHLENTVIPNIQRLIQRGIAEGSFRHEINVELITRLLIGQFDYVVMSDFTDKISTPMPEVLKTIILHFVRSIATEKGLKRLSEMTDL